MASPRAKNSNSASTITRVMPRATQEVGALVTRATTSGIRTAAVATRFHVIGGQAPRGTSEAISYDTGRTSGEKGSPRLLADLGGRGVALVTVAEPAVAAVALLEFQKGLQQAGAV